MKGLMRALSDLYDQGMALTQEGKELHAASQFAIYAVDRLEDLDSRVNDYVEKQKASLHELDSSMIECEQEMETMLPLKDRAAKRRYSEMMAKLAGYEERRNSVVSELERSAKLLRRR